MDLFESRGKKIRRQIRLFLPVFFLFCICALFLAGISSTSADTLSKEQATLEQALRKGAVHTYAITGRYPQSLSELTEEYHITYDHSKFVVDYVPSASNLFPMISVIPLSGQKGGSS